MKQGGGGGSRIFKGSKRGDIPRVEGGGHVLFMGSKRGGIPRVEGGGHVLFMGSKRGGVKKNPVNRNENLQTAPRPHKKNFFKSFFTSLTLPNETV